MKRISLLAALSFLLFFFGIGILAQDSELPDPGLAPDSPFYFLERILEGIGTFFTFGDLKKAERYAALAAERVAEAQAVVEKGKPEAAQIALKRYEDQLNRALARAERARIKGESIEEVTETVAEATGKHLIVLEGVLEKVPEQAKPAIEKAKEVSMTGQKNALRALAKENPERATEINLKAAEARLNRAKAKAEEGETEDAEEAITEFENQHKFGEEISQIAQGLGKDITTVEQLVGRATSIHLEILAKIYEKVPEQARPAIEDAMKVSLKGHEKAVEVLKEQDALGDIPEEVSLPEGVSQEVRERVQTRVQQELQMEEVLEGIDTSKSLRDICAEHGGTPEMCEQFPEEKFESFEQIEDYCTELGGQPEVCSTLEDKCRELGVTTPNECFILLMVSSVSAYQSAEMKVVPAQPLSEEEIQQQEENLKQRYIPGVSKVIIYTSPNCPHCVEAKSWFQQHGITYEEIDIFLSENVVKRDELMHKVGNLVVPIVKVEDEIIVGFTEESYSEFFGAE